ncbi:hypothetical protein I7I50_01118 [Histoplasma capsulatum G186AR]|uniref:Uncharacterized protein n=1 Tax=Ajellomyces capsulatus TaxID=5037 RepID=A0A8H7Z0E1_AJECA|nr:hypothetical protein I7I52_09059 [Histoplasma capsulatum]QSS73086.1 hypothetical protein I7I50_01118 [Histoplasma capsulatum G186AR]
MPKGKTDMKEARNKESLACRHQKKKKTKPNQNKNKSKHLLPATSTHCKEKIVRAIECPLCLLNPPAPHSTYHTTCE